MRYVRIIRMKDWWEPIIPIMLSCVYLSALIKKANLNTSLPELLSVFFLAIAIACIGFLLGEYTDQQEDNAKNRTNHIADLSKNDWIIIISSITALLTSSLFLAPSTNLMALALSLQTLLFLCYSMPPMRLKRFPIAAISLDSLYSGSLFGTLIFSTTHNIVITSALFLWLILKGIRNILQHLKQDPISQLQKPYLIPTITLQVIFILEVMFFSIVMTLCLKNIGTLFCLSLIVVYVIIKYIRIFPMQQSLAFNFNFFYESILPVFLLATLAASIDIRYSLLIVIHLILFPGMIQTIQKVTSYLVRQLKSPM